jgi:hypothetical protein
MVFVTNLEGKKADRVLVDVDSYEAVITKIGEIREFKTAFVNKETGKSEEKTQNKFAIEWKIANKGNAEGKIIPMFVGTRISKGSGSYSNSKLYDVLDKAGLIEEFKKANKITDDDIMEWLRKKLTDRIAKVITKTVNKNEKEKSYSVVDDIVKFLDNPIKVEEVRM